MRLGLYGGSFDPVHYGHLLLAECCREQCRLDAVWFVPAAVPPHKQDATLSPANQRIEMLQLAIGGHESLAVYRGEIERGGVSYTVDTLEQLHREEPQRELFFLMGADSLADVHRTNTDLVSVGAPIRQNQTNRLSENSCRPSAWPWRGNAASKCRLSG